MDVLANIPSHRPTKCRDQVPPTSRGSGLGLTISRDLIQAHGDTIDMDSAPGTGTTVRIELPGTA
jgi:signal transduction histidine kinase